MNFQSFSQVAFAFAVTPVLLVYALGYAVLMGLLGGRGMSAMKRDRGVNAWGTMIEGHGGMLDRLDSVVFAAPIFFHVVRYAWTP